MTHHRISRRTLLGGSVGIVGAAGVGSVARPRTTRPVLPRRSRRAAGLPWPKITPSSSTIPIAMCTSRDADWPSCPTAHWWPSCRWYRVQRKEDGRRGPAPHTLCAALMAARPGTAWHNSLIPLRSPGCMTGASTSSPVRREPPIATTTCSCSVVKTAALPGPTPSPFSRATSGTATAA